MIFGLEILTKIRLFSGMTPEEVEAGISTSCSTVMPLDRMKKTMNCADTSSLCRIQAPWK